MATEQPLEFIFHLNASVNPGFFNKKSKQQQEQKDEARLMVEWSDSKAKQIAQSKAIFSKSTAREFDFIVNKKLRSNAMMLHSQRSTAGGHMDNIGRGRDFK